jgi:hypothetical protein
MTKVPAQGHPNATKLFKLRSLTFYIPGKLHPHCQLNPTAFPLFQVYIFTFAAAL